MSVIKLYDNQGFKNALPQGARIRDVIAPVAGMKVKKYAQFGAASQTGTIHRVNAKVDLPLSSGRVGASGCVVVLLAASSDDLGGVVVDDKNNAVGIIVAVVDHGFVVLAPLQDIFKAYGLQFAESAPMTKEAIEMTTQPYGDLNNPTTGKWRVE